MTRHFRRSRDVLLAATVFCAMTFGPGAVEAVDEVWSVSSEDAPGGFEAADTERNVTPGEPRERPAPVSETDEGKSIEPGPAEALVASAVYPGLGQLWNDSEHKAAIVGGAEAFLVMRLVLEDRRTRHALRLYRETEESRYFEDYSQHFDTRQTLVWWVVVAALYSIADAYVDAHLMGFEDMRPSSLDEWPEAPGTDEGGLRIGLACRF